jgi:hypothetical protein
MSVMTRNNFAKALWPGVNAWYGKEYNDWPVQYTDLFDTHKSRRAYEEDVSVSSFGLASVKNEGDGIAYDSEQQGYLTRYNHVTYGLGFIITKEAFDDDLYDIVGERRAKALARSLRQTKEVIGANVYNRAFNSSYTGGDGKELCATDHPNIAGGTWQNELSTAADLSEAALEQAIIDMADWTDDRGIQIAVRPEKLIIPSELVFEAERILMSTGRVATADNDLNALKSMGKFSGATVNNYLTDADAWFIRTDVQNGMKYWERRADEFTTDNDFDTDNAKFKATARFSFGWTDPKAVFGSPGA